MNAWMRRGALYFQVSVVLGMTLAVALLLSFFTAGLVVLRGKGLPRPIYRQMLSPQIRVDSYRGWGPGRDSLNQQPDPAHLAWELGWGIFESAHGRAFWHSGHAEGWQNFCVRYPRRQLSVLLLSNSDNFERVAAQLLRLCLGEAPAPLVWGGYYDHRPRPEVSPTGGVVSQRRPGEKGMSTTLDRAVSGERHQYRLAHKSLRTGKRSGCQALYPSTHQWVLAPIVKPGSEGVPTVLFC
ncbi:serine hydrolase domain-containing protein [Hymenobacter metallicola]|uniref:hypothetical protein n=1 Tax=Hymenobacter metallicola TaxID=2563114 RepID=UPI001F0CEA54|nr:hypothetical protein [Hymenobacter metallicola]